jgi:hypothetical protein
MSRMLSTLRLSAIAASFAATTAALSACSTQNGDNTGVQYIDALGGYHR